MAKLVIVLVLTSLTAIVSCQTPQANETYKVSEVNGTIYIADRSLDEWNEHLKTKNELDSENYTDGPHMSNGPPDLDPALIKATLEYIEELHQRDSLSKELLSNCIVQFKNQEN